MEGDGNISNDNLFWFHEKDELSAVLCLHVDDFACGGCGPVWEETFKAIQEKFPLRKVRRGGGKFLGAQIMQNKESNMK